MLSPGAAWLCHLPRRTRGSRRSAAASECVIGLAVAVTAQHLTRRRSDSASQLGTFGELQRGSRTPAARETRSMISRRLRRMADWELGLNRVATYFTHLAVA